MPLAGPASMLGSSERLRVFEAELTLAARRTWPLLPFADAAAAIEAGMLAAAGAAASVRVEGKLDLGTDGSPERDDAASRTAGLVGDAAAALQRHGLPPDATGPVDWAAFGVIVPVLPGSPGAGASMLAALLTDVLQIEQRRVLLADLADPARSGLACAARTDGPLLARPHPQVHIRFSWRAQALVGRLQTGLPVIAPGMVPPPHFWLPPVQQPEVTVVDLGHDSWRVSAHPLAGAGAWLRRGTPSPCTVLVVRPSRPSLLHAEQVLTRLDPWVVVGAVTPPTQLVVMGARSWPAGVAGAAGRRVAALLQDAVFVPHDPDFAAAGVTAAVTPLRLRKAVMPLLHRWGLLPDAAAQATTSRTKGRS